MITHKNEAEGSLVSLQESGPALLRAGWCSWKHVVVFRLRRIDGDPSARFYAAPSSRGTWQPNAHAAEWTSPEPSPGNNVEMLNPPAASNDSRGENLFFCCRGKKTLLQQEGFPCEWMAGKLVVWVTRFQRPMDHQHLLAFIFVLSFEVEWEVRSLCAHSDSRDGQSHKQKNHSNKLKPSVIKPSTDGSADQFKHTQIHEENAFSWIFGTYSKQCLILLLFLHFTIMTSIFFTINTIRVAKCFAT